MARRGLPDGGRLLRPREGDEGARPAGVAAAKRGLLPGLEGTHQLRRRHHLRSTPAEHRGTHRPSPDRRRGGTAAQPSAAEVLPRPHLRVSQRQLRDGPLHRHRRGGLPLPRSPHRLRLPLQPAAGPLAAHHQQQHVALPPPALPSTKHDADLQLASKPAQLQVHQHRVRRVPLQHRQPAAAGRLGPPAQQQSAPPLRLVGTEQLLVAAQRRDGQQRRLRHRAGVQLPKQEPAGRSRAAEGGDLAAHGASQGGASHGRRRILRQLQRLRGEPGHAAGPAQISAALRRPPLPPANAPPHAAEPRQQLPVSPLL